MSASSTGHLLRMSQAAQSNMEADEHMHASTQMSAAPADDGDIQLKHQDAELNFQSQSASSGMHGAPHSASHPSCQIVQCALEGSSRHTGSCTVGCIWTQREAHSLSHTSEAGAGSAAGDGDAVMEHAIQDGGETPALPRCGTRPPAYSAAGPLRQPDFSARGSLEDDAVQTIVWHASDRRPAPIVANASIERLGSAQWDAEALPFLALVRPQHSMLSHIAPLLSERAHHLLLGDKLPDAAHFPCVSKGTGLLSSITCDAPCIRGQAADVLHMAVRVPPLKV